MMKNIKRFIDSFKRNIHNVYLYSYVLLVFIFIFLSVILDSEFITVGFAITLYTTANIVIRNSKKSDEQKKIDNNINDIGLISIATTYLLYKLIPSDNIVKFAKPFLGEYTDVIIPISIILVAVMNLFAIFNSFLFYINNKNKKKSQDLISDLDSF